MLVGVGIILLNIHENIHIACLLRLEYLLHYYDHIFGI
jgi:hypothetical protein